MAKCSQILKTGKRANDRANRAIDKLDAIKKKGDVLKAKYTAAQSEVSSHVNSKLNCMAEQSAMRKKLMAKQKSERKDLNDKYKEKLKSLDVKKKAAMKKRAQIWNEGKKLTKQYNKTDSQAAAAQDKAKSFMMKHKECKLKPITRKRKPMAKFPSKPPK